ncbi:MAG: MerR family transcriptional regulator [bacterium]
MAETDRDRPVYLIGVAAEMLDVSPQTLRVYEREKLVVPRRTEGNTRLYSERDVEELRCIIRLQREFGVNLAGLDVILHMRRRMERMQREFQEMIEYIGERLMMDFGADAAEGGESTGLVPLYRGKLVPVRKRPDEEETAAKKGAKKRKTAE